ncbi:MAG TPA: SDR family NAD(P)-dependent oxidoreductase [Steroidobacteraceae bacterium]|jgi:short-subunit dehydrogenase
MNSENRELAVITGASSGIGFELARLAARSGCNLILAADEADINDAAADLACFGTDVIPVQCDLATRHGVKTLLTQLLASAHAIDYLMANAGRGLGQAFLDQEIQGAIRVAHTNIDGTLYLLHSIGRVMRKRGRGRILITGSVLGFTPGSFQAVYNASAAFLDSFAVAFANELKGTGVSVTRLMPGPTDTAFFERANMLDTKLGHENKADPAEVAKVGYEAMMRGDASVVAGLSNKLKAAMAHVMPDTLLAEMHRRHAEPGNAQ